MNIILRDKWICPNVDVLVVGNVQVGLCQYADTQPAVEFSPSLSVSSILTDVSPVGRISRIDWCQKESSASS